MSELDKVPELKQILGAMIFAAKRPLSISEIRRCLTEVGAEHGKEAAVFSDIKNSEIKAALGFLSDELAKGHYGFKVLEVAGGYRLQSDAACGKWLRHMLAIGKPNRLSRPGLETLAIIAYRQPVARSEIESVRGVSVDHVIRTLMEIQLVRIVGRSDLPGRPLLYGTTQTFLEQFGLKSLKDLNDMEPMLLMRHAEGVGKKEDAESAFEEENMDIDQSTEHSGIEPVQPDKDQAANDGEGEEKEAGT